MRTLVTGAGGFIGGHVIRQLARRGEDVRALDLKFSEPVPDGVETIEASILDPLSVGDAMKGVDGVIHAAAIADLWAPGRFDFDRVNVVGTCRLLAECRKAHAKFVYVSSYTTLIGRDVANGAVLDERAEVAPSRLLGPYPKSKRQAELCVLSACEAGLDASIVMPTAPVGEGDARLTPPTKLILDLANARLPALLPCTLNLVDVEAVAAAIISARDNGQSGARYLIAGDDVDVRDLARMVSEICGAKNPRLTVPLWVAFLAARCEALMSSISRRPPNAPLTGVKLAALTCSFDASKAREVLGFSPRPVNVCLEEAINWLSAQGLIGEPGQR